MDERFYATMSVIRFISNNAKIKIFRSKSDFLADRIIQAGTEATLLAFMERLAKLMDTDLGEIYADGGVEFLKASFEPESRAILQWLREYPRIAAMIAVLPEGKVKEACGAIVIGNEVEKTGTVLSQGEFDINVKITTLSPLAHGADIKAGNATLFRRMQVLTNTGSILRLPFYSGNALRGEMRDCLADHFLHSIGIDNRRDNPQIALWFFHALYAGGALEEDSKAAKVLGRQLGANGAIKAEGIFKFRDTLPALSLLGCALGNRILPGRVKFSDYRPECIEWGNGNIPAGELMEWLYLTRREDYEGKDEGEKGASMIVNTECLKSGVILRGGIDVDFHKSDLEMSALGCGLNLLLRKGFIGAESRRGFGKVLIEVDKLPNEELYLTYLQDNKEKILEYLRSFDILMEQQCTLLI